MQFLQVTTNLINRIAGRKQEFDELLASGDISQIRSKMRTNGRAADSAMREYDTATHEVMSRKDKILTDKKGNRRGVQHLWKLPIPYQAYINEIALVFLYGRPVKWTQVSEGTDEAFAKFLDVIKRTRFNSKIRQCKRLAGKETESAMLFRVFKDDDGNPDVQIRVLAKSKGDEIYTRWDQYENLISVAWGYNVREKEDKVVYHFDIFTPEFIYRCTKKSLGWQVEKEINFIGKIPIILFQQEKEWEGVEHLINREEWIASRNADTNDYFADPIAVYNADVIKNLPEKGDVGKALYTNNKDGVQNAMAYVTWDNAPQSKKDELDFLEAHILSKSFTPNITLDTLKSISQLSAKALRTVMMLADIKASKRKESHDELLDRTGSLIGAIIGNVLDVSLKSQCDELSVAHEFQEPFGEDIEADIKNITACLDAEIMSNETAIEKNPLISDTALEKERIKAEADERMKQQQSIFGDDGGEAGAQSFSDGDDEEDGEEDEEKKPGDEKKSKKEKK
ncbi:MULTISPECIES: phage portal protein [Muribaculaceae]|uniref:Phage portal protein n=2 Tax=Muribaculaceae TaxID=2005473 RepID=A0A4Z0UZD9_9BACT|nr:MULTISPECIES: phage portal protein [Muribaculaceae]QCD37174.1 phage portal protein [Muribaculum gordoncarteri]TGG35098.1 phage portal protein [Duncaniella freteri]